MDRGGSAVVRKKTFAEKIKSREVQQFLVIVTFLFAPLLLLIVFTYLPFMRMVQFSFYNMKYWTEEICWSGKLCGCVPPDGDLSRLVGKRVLYGRSGGSVSFSIVLCHFDGIQSEGRICV